MASTATQLLLPLFVLLSLGGVWAAIAAVEQHQGVGLHCAVYSPAVGALLSYALRDDALKAAAVGALHHAKSTAGALSQRVSANLTHTSHNHSCVEAQQQQQGSV